MPVDQDVGDRRVLEQGLERPQSKKLVEDVADELLALSLVERLVLLRELLRDDIADFGLDLQARHLFKRLQVDEVDQSLVKLDLELGMLVAFRESAGVANGDQAMLLDRPLVRRLFIENGESPGQFSDLPRHIPTVPSSMPPPPQNRGGRGPC